MKKMMEDMEVFELARWYSLIEGVNIIADECEARGKNFNNLKISPLDLEKYIEGTCDIFARKIEAENIKNIESNIQIMIENSTLVPQEV